MEPSYCPVFCNNGYNTKECLRLPLLLSFCQVSTATPSFVPRLHFVTLSIPSLPNHPSLCLLLFVLHLSPLSHSLFSPTSSISHYSNSSSVTFGLSHPISPLKISALPLYPSSSSQPSSVCACLPPSFHQMVCVKTPHLTAQMIFFLPDIILTSGDCSELEEHRRRTSRG